MNLSGNTWLILQRQIETNYDWFWNSLCIVVYDNTSRNLRLASSKKCNYAQNQQ
jgi:hypothetical protein